MNGKEMIFKVCIHYNNLCMKNYQWYVHPYVHLLQDKFHPLSHFLKFNLY